MPNSLNPLTKRQLMAYGLLALPLAFANLPLYLHVPDYYTRYLGLELATLGSILLLIRLLDAIQDPLIGWLADRYPHACALMLKSGLCLLLIGMVALYLGPIANIAVMHWFIAAMVIATLGVSLCVINVNLMGARWDPDPHQRTRITTWREAFGLIGLLIASLFPAISMQYVSPTTTFQQLAVLLTLTILIALTSFMGLQKSLLDRIRLSTAVSRKKSHAVGGQQGLFFLTCLLAYLSSALPGVLFMFFVSDFLQIPERAGFYLLTYFLGGLLCLPGWLKLSEYWGKAKTWRLAMMLSILAFVSAGMIDSSAQGIYFLICFFSGCAVGVDLAFPPALLADITGQTQQHKTGRYYGLLSVLPKLMLAVASGLALTLLGWQGFVPGAMHSAQSLQWLQSLYAWLPCVIRLFAIALLWQFINKGKH